MGYKGRLTKKFIISLIWAIVAVACLAVITESTVQGFIYDTGVNYYSYNQLGDILFTQVPSMISTDITNILAIIGGNAAFGDYWSSLYVLIVLVLPVIAAVSIVVIIILMIVRRRIYPILDILGILIMTAVMFAITGVFYYCIQFNNAGGCNAFGEYYDATVPAVYHNLRYYALAAYFYDSNVNMMDTTNMTQYLQLVYTAAIYFFGICALCSIVDTIQVCAYAMSEANYVSTSTLQRRHQRRVMRMEEKERRKDEANARRQADLDYKQNKRIHKDNKKALKKGAPKQASFGYTPYSETSYEQPAQPAQLQPRYGQQQPVYPDQGGYYYGGQPQYAPQPVSMNVRLVSSRNNVRATSGAPAQQPRKYEAPTVSRNSKK